MDLDEAEVEGWVRELRRGKNQKANSRRIFEAYYGRVRGFFLSQGFSHDRAEDLSQEVFLRVFDKIQSFRKENRFAPWLFAIAANIARNERRWWSQQKRGRATDSIDERSDRGIPIQLPDESAPPDQLLFEKERSKAMKLAVDKLPRQMGRCVGFVLQGRKVNEIAVLLKLKPPTVRAHLHNARQRLRELLGNDFGPWRGLDEPLARLSHQPSAATPYRPASTASQAGSAPQHTARLPASQNTSAPLYLHAQQEVSPASGDELGDESGLGDKDS